MWVMVVWVQTKTTVKLNHFHTGAVWSASKGPESAWFGQVWQNCGLAKPTLVRLQIRVLHVNPGGVHSLCDCKKTIQWSKDRKKTEERKLPSAIKESSGGRIEEVNPIESGWAFTLAQTHSGPLEWVQTKCENTRWRQGHIKVWPEDHCFWVCGQ